MKVKIFGRKECNLCKVSLKKFRFFLEKWGLAGKVQLLFYDLDTLDGLTEGSLQDALEVPTIIIEKGGREIARWQKMIPKSEEFGRILMAED